MTPSKSIQILTDAKLLVDYYLSTYWNKYKENDKTYIKNKTIEKHIGETPKCSIVKIQNYLVPSCHKILMEKFKVERIWAVHDFISATSEPQYSVLEVDGKVIQYLTTGIIDTYFNKIPIVIEVCMENDYSTKYCFYYQKNSSDSIETYISTLKEHVMKNNIFKNKNNVFTGTGLEISKFRETSFDAIYMKEGLKSSIKENTLEYIKNLDDMKKNGMKTHRGILLSGSPGNGKTFCARAIATELSGKATVIWVTGSSIERPSEVKYLFQMARGMSPSLIIIEDIDGIGQSRESEGHGTNSLLSELLSQMDGANDNYGVFIIATTNYPTMVDSALRDRPQRFDRHYKIDVPTYDEIVRYMKDKTGISTEEISRKLVGKSFAYIDEVVDTAKMRVIKYKKKQLDLKCLNDALNDMDGEKNSSDVMVQ